MNQIAQINRQLCHEQISQALQSAAANPQHLAVMSIEVACDLNHSSEKSIGDQVLERIAARLEERLGHSHKCHRTTANRFTIILSGLFEPADTLLIGDGIRHHLSRPVDIQGRLVNITCSIGMSAFPKHGMDAVTLLRRAEQTMNRVRNEGGNNMLLWSEAKADEDAPE